MTSSAATLAQQLLAQIGQDFSAPTVDMSGSDFSAPETNGNARYSAVERIDVGSVVAADGAFKTIMDALSEPLKAEFDAGRISQADYTKAFTEMLALGLSTASNLAMQSEAQYWQNLTAQSQAQQAELGRIQARIAVETAKQEFATAQAQLAAVRSQDALVQLQLSTEAAKYDLAAQELQRSVHETATAAEKTKTTEAQTKLLTEQMEAARAQTADARTDGAAVSGSVKKQKALQDQQRLSYQAADGVKIGKLFTEMWIAQKTVDPDLTVPESGANSKITQVMDELRADFVNDKFKAE
jgi:hypothetical protein